MITRRVGIALLLIVTACGGSAEESALDERAVGEAHMAFVEAGRAKLQNVPESVRWNIETWYNATGLAQLDPGVWQARLDRACTQKFWANPAVLEALGVEFVAADSVHPIATPGAERPAMSDVYSMLWVMALNHCRDLVPIDMVRAGPPHFDSNE